MDALVSFVVAVIVTMIGTGAGFIGAVLWDRKRENKKKDKTLSGIRKSLKDELKDICTSIENKTPDYSIMTQAWDSIINAGKLLDILDEDIEYNLFIAAFSSIKHFNESILLGRDDDKEDLLKEIKSSYDIIEIYDLIRRETSKMKIKPPCELIDKCNIIRNNTPEKMKNIMLEIRKSLDRELEEIYNTIIKKTPNEVLPTPIWDFIEKIDLDKYKELESHFLTYLSIKQFNEAMIQESENVDALLENIKSSYKSLHNNTSEDIAPEEKYE